MTAISNINISGSGNQLFQGASAGGDLVLGNNISGDKIGGDKITTHIYYAGQTQIREDYAKMTWPERLDKARSLTDDGIKFLSSDKKKAASLFIEALDCHPKIPEAHEMLGLIDREAEQYESAINRFQEAIECMKSDGPGCDEVDEFCNRINAHIKDTNWQKKVQWLIRFLK